MKDEKFCLTLIIIGMGIFLVYSNWQTALGVSCFIWAHHIEKH